jgi:hypothetical protein
VGFLVHLRASLRAAACSGAVGVLLLAAGQPAAAPAALELGVYSGASGQPTALQDPTVLDSYIAMVGRKPHIVMDYKNLTDPLLTPIEISNVQAHGVRPMVTWQLYQSGWGGPTLSLQDVAAGLYDGYVRAAAELARGLPFDVMIRFGHEMNGDWYEWSGNPTAYVNAWRHVVSVFRAESATNVRWVWSPNVDYGSYPFAAYFPGDTWIDYVGLDGYNWGASGQGTNRWESLAEVFSSSYQQLTQMSARPVIITETASSEIGGDKAAWIRDGFLSTIPQQFPRVVAVTWFNRNQEEDWRINSSSAALSAYREVVASSLYGGSGSTSDTGGSGSTSDTGGSGSTSDTGGNKGGGKGHGRKPRK